MKFLKEYNDWKYFTQDEIEEIKETYDEMVIDLDLNPNRFQILKPKDSNFLISKFNLDKGEVSEIRIFIRTIALDYIQLSDPRDQDLELHNQIKSELDKRIKKIQMLGYNTKIEELESSPFVGKKKTHVIGWSLEITK
jgi:hypothetical protein